MRLRTQEPSFLLDDLLHGLPQSQRAPIPRRSLDQVPFIRESIRHAPTVRETTVAAVERVVPSIIRVTLEGASLADFAAFGPADHVKLYFPDPSTGEITFPITSSEGRQRADTAVVISRDYTPLRFHTGLLDIDFVVHGDEGPASAWAARATVGHSLVVVGPRGSRLAPSMDSLVVVADETALPSVTRWLELGVPTTAIFDVADASVKPYFPDIDAEWVYRADGPNRLEESLRSLGPIDSATFVFLAGEANTLVPLRRYLRHELGLPADQVWASGYWRRGVTNLDHHAPLDPRDPD